MTPDPRPNQLPAGVSAEVAAALIESVTTERGHRFPHDDSRFLERNGTHEAVSEALLLPQFSQLRPAFRDPTSQGFEGNAHIINLISATTQDCNHQMVSKWVVQLLQGSSAPPHEG